MVLLVRRLLAILKRYNMHRRIYIIWLSVTKARILLHIWNSVFLRMAVAVFENVISFTEFHMHYTVCSSI